MDIKIENPAIVGDCSLNAENLRNNSLLQAVEGDFVFVADDGTSLRYDDHILNTLHLLQYNLCRMVLLGESGPLYLPSHFSDDCITIANANSESSELTVSVTLPVLGPSETVVGTNRIHKSATVSTRWLFSKATVLSNEIAEFLVDENFMTNEVQSIWPLLFPFWLRP